jgi:peroxiredoxin
MAMTPSNMVELGSRAADFALTDVVNNQTKSLSALKGDKVTVVMFICNHCPYVIHLRQAIIELANHYSGKGVSFIAISSNDKASHPEDGPDKMKQLAVDEKFPFPYLFDETQEVAKAYEAACTPDFFVFDSNLLLRYRGQFDDSRPSNSVPPSGKDIIVAIDALLSGNEPDKLQKPSIGCNIKWKK